ncbi:TonB-dependent receptor domain-containing protein [Pseudoruegeria sp. HB172150]|uniref:TonB-dependent receptor domain-containing protein n=1 Tax=Pseudoruegeria sp. HB172150 TaxID=2721164 RepID=UPI001551C898|nr:TonB-dependent receptor [Pseudoruegeria sp. HB172150]
MSNSPKPRFGGGSLLRLMLSTCVPVLPTALVAQDADYLGTVVLGLEAEGGETEASTVIDSETLNETYGGDVVNAIRDAPGVFTRSPSDNPSISVNIRGMQGKGRVNTMIEGVPQTNRNLSGHAGSFDDQIFVDPNLISQIDISRGAVPGAAGLGSLAGAVNLRLLDFGDILEEGKSSGGLARITFGDNGLTWSGLLSGAWRGTTESGRSWASLVAISDYDKAAHFDGDGTQADYGDTDSSSAMFRFKTDLNSVSELEVVGMANSTDFLPRSSSGYYWETDKTLLTLNYGYKPGDGIWDLDVSAYYQVDDLSFPGHPEQTGSSFIGRQGTDTGMGVNATNTSRVTLGAGMLELSYGVALTQNEYIGNAQSGANAEGELLKAGVFVNGTWEIGRFDATVGFRYDYWKATGVTEATAAGTGSCPADASNGRCIDAYDDRDGAKLNPSLVLGYGITDNLRIYGSYAETMRPPTVSEMFYPGGHSFSGTVTPIGNNLELDAEEAATIEAGFQFARKSMFQSDDRGWLDVNYFQNDIENYITASSSGTWDNVPGTVRMSGVELTAGYETRRFITELSFTVADTEQPYGFYAGIGNDFGRLPDDFGSLNIGLKFMDGDAQVGTVIRYVGDSVIAFIDEPNSYRLDPYTLVDLYGSWKVTDGVEVFANVTNLLDKTYYEANTGIGDSLTAGPGRAIQVGATFRF